MNEREECPFCNVKQDQLIYEDDLIIAFWDVYPVSPGHALLIPKRHVATWFDASEGGTSLDDQSKMVRYLERNPIAAWAGGKGTGQKTFFNYADGRFTTTFSVTDELRSAFQELVRELVEWRLTEYLQRPSTTTDSEDRLVCRVIHANRRPILKLPDREKVAEIPYGWTDVLIDGKSHEAKFAKQYVNVLRVAGSEENVLGEVLRNWYGPDVGMPGTRFDVLFEPTQNGFMMSRATDVGTDSLKHLPGEE